MKTPNIKKERYTISTIIALFLISTSNISLANESAEPLDLDTSILTSLSSGDAELASKHDIGRSLNSNNTSVSTELVSFTQPPKSLLTDIQDRFLTIHYGKTEKIKAVYAHGGYGIAYQQEW